MTCKNIFLYTILLMMISLNVHSASFDCAKATTSIEKMICLNAQLYDLDELLVVSYKKAMSRTEDKKLLKSEQQQWLKSTRNVCQDVECLKDAYAVRITELNEKVATHKQTFSVSGTYQRYYRGKPDVHKTTISIKALQNGQIQVQGQSIWVGSSSTNVNMGEVEGVALLENNQAYVKDESCELTLLFSAKTLIVENETGCGGLNVTFNGEYRKIGSDIVMSDIMVIFRE